MNALGWALIHFVWQGTALGALLAIARFVIGDDQPRARYVLGCLTLLAMVLSVPITALCLADFTTFPSGLVPTTGSHLVFGAVAPEGTRLFAGAHQWVDGALPWVVPAWGADAALLLARVLGGWSLAGRQVRGGVPLDHDVTNLAEQIGVSRTFRILVSPLVSVPYVFGWLKPVVMLPASAVTRLSPIQLESVLAHELAHIARYDFLVNVCQTLIESLLFYHPAVWWTSGTIREAREACCDDVVVAITGDRILYAHTLFALEESRMRLVPAATSSGLKERIARLLGERRDRQSAPATIAAAAVLILSIAATTWLEAEPARLPAAPAPPVGLSTAALPAVPVPPRAPARVRAGALPNPPPPQAVAGGTEDREEWLVSDGDWEQIETAIAQARDELKRAKAQFKSQKLQEQLQRIHSDEFRQALERAKEEAEKARTAVQSAEFHADVLKAAAAGIRDAQKAAEDAELARREAQKAADAAQLALQKTIEELTTRDMERARRRRTADQRWSEGDTPGSTTARGRVYVREGEPDETTTVNGVETWRYKDTTKTPVTREYQFDAHGERIK